MKTQQLKRIFLTGLTVSAIAITAACSSNSNSNSNSNSDAARKDLLAEPIIWSVTDADSEIILYPTFHALPEGVEWKTQNLTDAIARADEIWYEIPVDADTDPALQRVMMTYGMSSEGTLADVLDAETYVKLEVIADEIGLPMQALNTMRPWLVAITIPVIQMTQGGFDPNLGVESQIQKMTGDKPTRALETAEQQIRFFADMPKDKEIEMLVSSINDYEEGIDSVKESAMAWAKGDFVAIEDEFVTEMKSEYPDLYDVILYKRNVDWVEQLDAEMKGSGVDFVAVGAAHLVGEDGVPELMRAKGYDVKILTVK